MFIHVHSHDKTENGEMVSQTVAKNEQTFLRSISIQYSTIACSLTLFMPINTVIRTVIDHTEVDVHVVCFL